MKLLSIDSDAKTIKGRKRGFLTGALFMSPERSGKGNVCPFAKGCVKTCIAETGMGVMPSVRKARQARRDLYDSDPDEFVTRLGWEVRALVRKAEKLGLTPVVRLNATSDIRWERTYPELFLEFPEVQFYDYTKWPSSIRGKALPKNYHLTYSWTPEWTTSDLLWHKRNGFNVAAPFAPHLLANYRTDALPGEYLDSPVIDGDDHDLIFLHPAGSLVGLRFKGKGGSRPTYKPGMFALEF
jgi:hypothetical protein